MINLLPNKRKAEIRAARTNVALVRYIGILLVALAFILGALYVSYSVLGMTQSTSQDRISSNDTKASVYNTAKAQVDTLNANLAQSRGLLDQEVRYSKVFVNIAQLMPANTIFGKLSFTADSFNGSPTTAKVYAKSATDITALQQRFQQSTMVSGVNVQNISSSGNGTSGYPASADITFVINRTAAQ